MYARLRLVTLDSTAPLGRADLNNVQGEVTLTVRANVNIGSTPNRGLCLQQPVVSAIVI